ncbi:hypothetical protein [Bacillus bingmayongensis]|uniref:hypothetical protein n=1 Tax=Bacillus bingmayongensis TaxID=1150157 RepID=UPI0002D38D85|nr:hypothetical protein [Bacillus bingmayongensis]MBY0595094.1 hypothetical protein [Bacillus bingmayongensis]
MNTFTLKNSKKELLGILGLCAAMTVIVSLARMGVTFEMANIVSGLSYSAALTGLYRARRAWKAGKGLKKALTVAFSWNVVALVISVLGDSLITYLLDNHIETLAKH